jgi:hypothetical protein
MNNTVMFDNTKVSGIEVVIWLANLSDISWKPATAMGVNPTGVIFHNEEDATAFKLRFGL